MMDNQNVTQSIQEFYDFWRLLFPTSEPPGQEQWAYWTLRHGTEIVREGILELAMKHRKLEGKMDAAYMAKFASAVMKRLSLQEKAATPVPPATQQHLGATQ